MEKEASLALKYWPIWTLGAVLICVVYVRGVFHYPGDELLTLLTFTDYVSIALPTLPYILFLMIANLVMSDDPLLKEMESRERFEKYEKAQLEKPLEERDWYKREKATKKNEGIITLVTPMAVMIYWLTSNALPPAFAWVSFLILIAACAVLALGFYRVIAKRYIMLGIACIGAFAVLGVFYSSGLFVGSRNYTGRPDTVWPAAGLVDAILS